jgi:hypothetical protein
MVPSDSRRPVGQYVWAVAPLQSAGWFGAGSWPAGRAVPWIPPPWRRCRAKAEMVGGTDNGPAGDREPEGRTAEDANRVMLAIRAAHIRAKIAEGDVPPGYRIDDEGTGFVRIGNPAWPLKPLDRFCDRYGEPSLELLLLIRKVLPDFDPEADRRGWLDVAEFVRRTGRQTAEVEAMGHDELVAFFRHEVFNRRRPPTEVEQRPNVVAKPALPSATVTPGAAAAGDTPPEKTTSELLREWLGDPERKLKLVATLSSDRAGELIGKPGSCVREAGDAGDDLKAEFKAYRALRRYERKRRRQ